MARRSRLRPSPCAHSATIDAWRPCCWLEAAMRWLNSRDYSARLQHWCSCSVPWHWSVCCVTGRARILGWIARSPDFARIAVACWRLRATGSASGRHSSRCERRSTSFRCGELDLFATGWVSVGAAILSARWSALERFPRRRLCSAVWFREAGDFRPASLCGLPLVVARCALAVAFAGWSDSREPRRPRSSVARALDLSIASFRQPAAAESPVQLRAASKAFPANRRSSAA